MVFGINCSKVSLFIVIIPYFSITTKHGMYRKGVHEYIRDQVSFF